MAGIFCHAQDGVPMTCGEFPPLSSEWQAITTESLSPPGGCDRRCAARPLGPGNYLSTAFRANAGAVAWRKSGRLSLGR